MKKILILTVALFSIGYSQISSGAATSIDGRSINKTVLYVDCAHTGSTRYTDTGGVNVSSLDYYPTETMRGLILTGGSGNIVLVMAGGGQMVIPFTVDAGYSMEVLRGFQIKKILTSGTTFTGRIFPLW